MNQHVTDMPLRREPLKPSQEKQAEEVVRKAATLDEHYPINSYTKRRRTTTHAIDNVTPDILADRDDGIYVEHLDTAGGGHKVTVTIADVAAAIPFGSPLSFAAHERAFTIYRPDTPEFGGNDPMFGTRAEEAMSLEHGQERLGLSVVMELDADYQLTHTSFEPVVTTPDNVSYDMAGERIKQGDAQFTNMAGISQQIFEKTFGGDEQLLKDATATGNLMRMFSDEEMREARMVATYMLLANHAVASFFEQTGLPFAYRTYDGTHVSDEGIPRAVYSTDWTEHKALARIGLKGAYCHFTSPIRRGPDYFNALMVHYACDVKRIIEEGALANVASPEHDQVKHALWNQMPEILSALETAQSAPDDASKQVALMRQLRRAKVILQGDDGFDGIIGSTRVEEKMYESLIGFTPPLKKGVLDAAVKEINTLNDQERDAWRDPALQAYLKGLDAQVPVKNYTQAGVAQMNKREFSSVLRNCVRAKELPNFVREEALTRIKEDNINLAEAAVYLLIGAKGYEGEDWQTLRKSMIRKVRGDVVTVYNALNMAEHPYYGYLEEGAVRTEEIPLPSGTEGGRQAYVRAALLHTHPENLAPPFYSVGHDSRAALSHARYSFLEHYAFDDLHPFEEAAIANVLYANLGERIEEKEAGLRKMVEQHGGIVDIQHRAPDRGRSQHHVAILAKGGSFGEGVSSNAEADTEEEARQKALRRLLNKPIFKGKVQAYDAQQTNTLLRPYDTLKAQVEEQGWKMSVVVHDIGSKSTARFKAQVLLYLDDERGSGNKVFRKYEGEWMNQDTAINQACIRALMEHPQLTLDAPIIDGTRSWMGDAAEGRSGGEVQKDIAAESLAIPEPHVLVDAMAQHELLGGASANKVSEL